jgi:S-methylmethionine-dependent homocysteine/selenocysteine methylase
MTASTRPLPQQKGEPFLTDAGCETDIIFNRGVEIREFAAHTLLEDDRGRDVLADYYRGFLSLASDVGAGMVLDAPTWKAHPHWAADLGVEPASLAQANREAVAFSSALREEYRSSGRSVVVNGLVGPRGDAYSPDALLAADEAERYHTTQIGWLADAGADMVTALTFTQSDEAVGAVRAAAAVGLPVVVSFTVETDGRLPTGEALGHAIEAVDQATDGAAAYFMVNCAHPDHFIDVIDDSAAFTRVRGLRCNASRQSHAELDEAEVLDDGDPQEFAEGYAKLSERLPSLNVYGGCCGSDLRHVTAVAGRLVG